jgi:hypothetical protein
MITGHRKCKGRKSGVKSPIVKSPPTDDCASTIGDSVDGGNRTIRSSNLFTMHSTYDSSLSTVVENQNNVLSPAIRLIPATIYPEPEVDMSSQSHPVEWMDTSTDVMDGLLSPYLIICESPSSDELDHSPSPFAASTYADSMFGSDSEDVTAYTESDINIMDSDTIFQPLLCSAIHRLISTYLMPRQKAECHDRGSAESSRPSSYTSHAQAGGLGFRGLDQPLAGNKRSREFTDQGGENEQPRKRKGKAIKADESLPHLACPFNKLDPLKHDKCYTFVLKDISRVK